MLFRPDPGGRRRVLLPLGVAAAVIVLLTGGFVVLRVQSSHPGPAAAAAQPPAAGAGSTARGWNLHDGGQLGVQQAVPPAAAPNGASVPGPGDAARIAGPGNYAGFRPAALILPSGRRTVVQPAGVRTDGTLAVPDDPEQIGWWTGGALAGERYGGVVLAGHIDSQRYGLGALAEMVRVRAGASLTVLGQGGQRLRYQVVGVRQIDKARLAAGTGAFAQDVPQRLVLITCGGPFDRRLHHYRDNIVVTADPVR